MNYKNVHRVSVLSGFIASTAILAALSTLSIARAQNKAVEAESIPAGTILPIRLNNSLSTSKSHPGQIVTARIMQDVPLANGGKIREGSKVIGHVVNVSSPEGAKTEQISLQFDKVISSGRTIPIKTNLRAVAGFVEVREAETPTDGPVSMPIAATQVGGDTAYTSGGDVVSRNGADVGKSVTDGVLVQVDASNRQGGAGAPSTATRAPRPCRVFSSDACGTYGLSNIPDRACRENGTRWRYCLDLRKGQLELPSDAGMLLRGPGVIAAGTGHANRES